MCVIIFSFRFTIRVSYCGLRCLFPSLPFSLWLPLLWYIIFMFFTRRMDSSSSCPSSSEIVYLACLFMLFWGCFECNTNFLCGSRSSFAFISISWVFKFPMKAVKFNFSLLLRFFKVVVLTSQELNSVLIIFRIFWSLEIGLDKGMSKLVIVINWESNSSIDSPTRI